MEAAALPGPIPSSALCSPRTGTGTALPQQTDIALTTSTMIRAVMTQRPHTMTMATPYSGKPGGGRGGCRVSSGEEDSS